jgi:hypothetical protein
MSSHAEFEEFYGGAVGRLLGQLVLVTGDLLADTCHQYGANCRWDGGATYDYKFRAS